MPEQLRCDPDGLRAFASSCEEHAQRVGTHDHTSPPNATRQATIGAVADLHDAASNAAAVLADRIRSTASLISDAADEYARSDDQSGDGLARTMGISMS
jgi:hypothetical protein